MIYWNDNATNIVRLADLFHFESVTARAWLRSEGQGFDDGADNPLNVRNSPLAIGRNSGGFARFPNVDIGLVAAYRLVTDNAPWYGYDSILAEAGSGDALAQGAAIELSSWAAGHYGATATTEGHVRALIRVYMEVEPVTVVTISTFPPRTFRAPAGLRRFTATSELPALVAPYSGRVDANVAIDGPGPHGSDFLRLSSGGSIGKYILAEQVTLDPLPVVPPPDLTDDSKLVEAIDAAYSFGSALLVALDEARAEAAR